MIVKKIILLDPDAPCEDAIDGLLSCLAQRIDDASEGDLVFRVHRNSETGAVALFPETAKSESDWQERALAMHANQQPLPKLDDKPSEIVSRYHEIETRRGD